ncbi:hypothetical protein H0264_35690 [Nocardia huaxiensis]|uniref:Uncharacterized protein n=1 Tax=Nocardia huaxiensis TaxID=2755382 RepID=A0A7D6ZH69_9NOCA|nr:hypothetical protein [Nocardia huaxiensis]QLY30407.1 hypothetical protein H0264_35690 [Nocardia huaxiensis]
MLIMSALAGVPTGGKMVERKGPGKLEITPAEFDADLIYQEIQQLGSVALGESADFCGRSEASITMGVAMTEDSRRRFLTRASRALDRIIKEAKDDQPAKEEGQNQTPGGDSGKGGDPGSQTPTSSPMPE